VNSDDSTADSTSRRRTVRLLAKILVAAAVVAATVYAARATQIPSCGDVQASLKQAGPLAPVYFAAAYVAATVLFVPGTVVTMLAGLAFGIWWGTAIAVVSATTGATLAFLLARWLGRGALAAWLAKKPWYARLQREADADGFNYVVFMRLVPLVPFNAFNFASGLMPIRVRDYVLGSLLGMLPGTFAYAYFGVAGCGVIDALSSGELRVTELPHEVWLQLGGAILVLSAVTLVPVWLRRRRQKTAKTS
jgi:uncharacterized membrane protein YdjX (TVP38/TMEM64 family)